MRKILLTLFFFLWGLVYLYLRRHRIIIQSMLLSPTRFGAIGMYRQDLTCHCKIHTDIHFQMYFQMESRLV